MDGGKDEMSQVDTSPALLYLDLLKRVLTRTGFVTYQLPITRGWRRLASKLSVGGYVIVDDYSALEGCKQAVDEFRAREGITDPIENVDWAAV